MIKDPKINDDGTMSLKTLLAIDKEWIEIDDVIAWLKCLSKNCPVYSEFIHYQIKSLIKMKNSNSTKQ